MSHRDDRRGARSGLGRLRRPRLLIIGAALVAAALPAAGGSAPRGSALPAPTSLQTFLKRIGEPRTLAGGGIPEFSRTPSFAWAPVRGAGRYEFELATSSRFRGDNDLVWSNRQLTTPAVAIPLALPWITGQPASLYWRVRAVNSDSVSAWSSPSAFNMRWSSIPKEWKPKPGSAADKSGYVRWHPVDGATGYQVWFVNAGKVFTTITNVADEREYWAFHQDSAWTGDVEWRVRAVRTLYGSPLNKLPAVSYGPWSPKYSWSNNSNPLSVSSESYPLTATSDAVSYAHNAHPHSLMPAFLFAGDGSNNGYGLHRVYVFSDKDCVNAVFQGAIVGGPAYAPRSTGPLELPQTSDDLIAAGGKFLKDGSEGDKTYGADIGPVKTSEAPPQTETTGASANANGTTTTTVKPAKVDLWDRSWPSGRYYWTVVPVEAVLIPPESTSGSGGSGGSDIPIGGIGGSGSSDMVPTGWQVEYHETVLPQDACQRGRVLEFGKQSIDPQPADSHSAPYATGLAPNGRLLSAKHSGAVFYGQPLVSWAAAPAAIAYDVEWSRTHYPWKAAGRKRTYATSALLPLTPGTWWYRVRGINDSLPGVQAMSWSDAVRIRIAAPRFAVVGG